MNPQKDHSYFKCNCYEPRCKFCDGGLAMCEVCYGFEGTLTTHCCGRRLTELEEERIYTIGDLDFKNGEWIDEPNFPRHS